MSVDTSLTRPGPRVPGGGVPTPQPRPPRVAVAGSRMLTEGVSDEGAWGGGSGSDGDPCTARNSSSTCSPGRSLAPTEG